MAESHGPHTAASPRSQRCPNSHGQPDPTGLLATRPESPEAGASAAVSPLRLVYWGAHACWGVSGSSGARTKAAMALGASPEDGVRDQALGELTLAGAPAPRGTKEEGGSSSGPALAPGGSFGCGALARAPGWRGLRREGQGWLRACGFSVLSRGRAGGLLSLQTLPWVESGLGNGSSPTPSPHTAPPPPRCRTPRTQGSAQAPAGSVGVAAASLPRLQHRCGETWAVPGADGTRPQGPGLPSASRGH